MDLWIRSQDKERLIKPIDFYIEETIDYVNKHSEFDIYGLNLANDDIRIGTYQTKERALEVLDEIQTELATLNYQYLHRGQHFITTASNVYEMPEE